MLSLKTVLVDEFEKRVLEKHFFPKQASACRVLVVLLKAPSLEDQAQLLTGKTQTLLFLCLGDSYLHKHIVKWQGGTFAF